MKVVLQSVNGIYYVRSCKPGMGGLIGGIDFVWEHDKAATFKTEEDARRYLRGIANPRELGHWRPVRINDSGEVVS